MSITILLASLIFTSSDSATCEVTLVNSASVDLILAVGEDNVLIGPGESALVPVTSLGTIEFGAVNHEFTITPVLPILCQAQNSAEVEARSDGQLWLSGVSKQPQGLPLKPDRLQDLTGSPPNNSFKRTAAPKYE
jgi:hypothetical protein